MTATTAAAGPATATAPAAAKPSRNRYIDTLRALAIVRVVVYHAFGWAWLTYVLPAMGVMFAIAGSLMAASLSKAGARKAVWSRIRRLLPALWTFAAVALPLMFWHGWSSSDPDHPLHKLNLIFWLFPLEDPPGSSWGEPFWEVLWYLRAYLIFVLVSPILYFAYKKLGWVVVALPLAVLAALHLTGFRLPDPIDGIMWDFVTYAACWIAGFAHRDGRLHRLPVAAWAAMTAVIGGIGLYWLFTHPTDWGFDLNEEPIARTLWSLAFVLIVLRFRPTMAMLDRAGFKWVAESVRVINARAITIYLWHFPLITLGALVLEHYQVPWATFQYVVWMLVLEAALVLVAVLLFGWVEDVSAKRRASLWPAATPALAGAGASVALSAPVTVSPGTASVPAAGSSVSPGYGTSVSPGYGTRVSSGDGTSVSPGYGTSVSPGYGTSVSPGYGTSVSPGYGTSVSPGYHTGPAPASGRAPGTSGWPQAGGAAHLSGSAGEAPPSAGGVVPPAPGNAARGVARVQGLTPENPPS
ncbi:acyltransferase family protein [Paractinoplanes maris]|uniref:acyltransferase family protein n=1 Tax=Paractinoplanes maris TaxID=1734446 RepID=UPI00201FBCDA|nr:acyltransferase family protein [Actinoplanes maris]